MTGCGWYWFDPDHSANILAIWSDQPLNELAVAANAFGQLYRSWKTKSLDCARRAGLLLSLAKDKLPHGQYEQWVRENFSGGVSTARLCKQIAENWDQAQDAATMTEARELLKRTPEEPDLDIDDVDNDLDLDLDNDLDLDSPDTDLKIAPESDLETEAWNEDERRKEPADPKPKGIVLSVMLTIERRDKLQQLMTANQLKTEAAAIVWLIDEAEV